MPILIAAEPDHAPADAGRQSSGTYWFQRGIATKTAIRCTTTSLNVLNRGLDRSLQSIRPQAGLKAQVKVGATTSAQIRVDAKNILNHPLMGNPNLNINGATVGQMLTVTGSRTFQGILLFRF